MFFHRKRTWMGLVISASLLAVTLFFLLVTTQSLNQNKFYTDQIAKTLNELDNALRDYQAQGLAGQYLAIQTIDKQLIAEIGDGYLAQSAAVTDYLGSTSVLFQSIQSPAEETRNQSFQQLKGQLATLRARITVDINEQVLKVEMLSQLVLGLFVISASFFWYSNINSIETHKIRVLRLIRRQRIRHKNSIVQRAAQVAATQRLFDGLNHHLRTPISTSIGLLEILRNSTLTRDQKGLIDKVNTASFQVLQQIDTLMGLFGKDIFSDGGGNAQIFNINALIDESFKEFALQADAQGQYINVDDSIKPNTIVKADFVRLKIALMGTIHSVLRKAQNTAVKIHIRLLADSSKASATLCVSFNYMPLTSNSNDIAGNCIDGNSILGVLNFDSDTLKQLYEKVGVNVFDDRNAHGIAKLHFEAPVTIVEAESSELGSKNSLSGHYAIVDDLASSRNLLSYFIEQSNGTAQVFSGGNELLVALKNGTQFDAIILDYHMPSISGLETLELINALYKDNQVPIVMISADPGLKSKSLDKYLAVESVLIKPIKRRDLVDVLWSLQSKVQFTLPNSDLKILLVEDDPISAEIMINMLSGMRYRVVHVMSGAEAEQATKSKKFDVVLVDIRLPDTNGHDLVKKIKKRSPDGEHMIFIAITAHNAQDYAEVSESIGIDYHLTKPVTAEDLKRALSVAVAYSAN